MVFKLTKDRISNIFDSALAKIIGGIVLAGIFALWAYLGGFFSSTEEKPANEISSIRSQESFDRKDGSADNALLAEKIAKLKEPNDSLEEIEENPEIEIVSGEYEFSVSRLRTAHIFEIEAGAFSFLNYDEEFYWEYKLSLSKKKQTSPGRCKLEVEYPGSSFREGAITYTQNGIEKDWFIWGNRNTIEISVNSIVTSTFDFPTSKKFLYDYGIDLKVVCEGDTTILKEEHRLTVFFT